MKIRYIEEIYRYIEDYTGISIDIPNGGCTILILKNVDEYVVLKNNTTEPPSWTSIDIPVYSSMRSALGENLRTS